MVPEYEPTGSGTSVPPGMTYVDYCGERFPLPGDRRFTIGREADLSVDDNPYLHRRFLLLHNENGLWWLTNLGSHLSASVSAGDVGFSATLGPGARMPLVFGETTVVFTAGPTTYELIVYATAPQVRPVTEQSFAVGRTTEGVPMLTESQKLLIVVLAEEILRREGTGASAIPSSAKAAARLGWPLTKFNRKLDNVCDKLDQLGVSGMRAGGGKLASNRRARLIEYAISSRIVTRDDLPLIDEEAARNAAS
ncbi:MULTISPECIES: FHA domain-containing protein [unclassified Gordonia (in: high G+C Gram-positive bacteria)]